MSIFQRLTQNLKGVSAELGHLVEEEDTPMRQRNLTRLWMGAAAQKPRRRGRMVRRTERPMNRSPP